MTNEDYEVLKMNHKTYLISCIHCKNFLQHTENCLGCNREEKYPRGHKCFKLDEGSTIIVERCKMKLGDYIKKLRILD